MLNWFVHCKYVSSRASFKLPLCNKINNVGFDAVAKMKLFTSQMKAEQKLSFNANRQL